MNQETQNYGTASRDTHGVVQTETFPIAGTTMTWNLSENSLIVEEDGAPVRTYSSGSILRISINANDEYEVEDPGPAIPDYNFNKRLTHENLTCFSIAARTGIGVMDFRDFRIKNIWGLDACAIGVSLTTDAVLVGFADDAAPCYQEINDPDATCSH